MASAALVNQFPGLYLGPLVLGPLIQSVMQGLIIQMSRIYFSRAQTDHRLLKGIIILLNILALLQTCGAFYDVWTIFIVGFGHWDPTRGFSVAQKLQPVAQATMSSPVQAYYIWRCWKVTNHNWFITVPLICVLASSWICSVISTNYFFEFNFTELAATIAATPLKDGAPPPPTPIPINGPLVAWLVSTASLDVAITGILLTYLLISKSKSKFQGLNDTINRLVFVLWETAIPPCICGLTACLTYLLLFKSSNSIDLFFQGLIGKFYIISLLETSSTSPLLDNVSTGRLVQLSQSITILDSRLTLNAKRGLSHEMSPWSARARSQVRVEITTATKEDGRSPGHGDRSSLPDLRPSPEHKIDYDQPYDDEEAQHHTVQIPPSADQSAV
ncbi:hypothetical protein BOTBODRAFT_186502 [Botryobasidium botryosum FD-172 SS1]|uniref:DUF6534 domain-containing protein n=1 Tax=Botryobasidium botryosum (strain FD-172 SS1) TaxID=930990 RepID=A0A067MY57_BOTB1|nr:hypothetical protein BOTBODRAFT_186502 [Botryobasidium botryosum FD-172 SS1]